MADAGRAADGERLVADRVFGIIGGVAVLLALVFGVRSCLPGGQDTGAGPASAIPTLVVLSPRPGDTVPQPVVVEFDAGAPLELAADGWQADGRHLHLFADQTELMPAPGDIVGVGGTRYRWTLPRLPAGPATLRMTWSGESHRSLAEGASAPVAVTLQ